MSTKKYNNLTTNKLRKQNLNFLKKSSFFGLNYLKLPKMFNLRKP